MGLMGIREEELTMVGTDSIGGAVVRSGAANPNAFWELDRIRGAQNALDVWASCRWARIHGVEAAVPTIEAIFEHPRAHDGWFDRLIDSRTGQRLIEEVYERTASTAILCRSRLVELGVDWALMHCEASPIAVGLLLRLYPRVGTYQRQEYEQKLEDPVASIVRSFRPKALRDIVGTAPNKYLNRRVDSVLSQLHRDALEEIAGVSRMAPEVFEAEIRAVKVPQQSKITRRQAAKIQADLLLRALAAGVGDDVLSDCSIGSLYGVKFSACRLDVDPDLDAEPVSRQEN